MADTRTPDRPQLRRSRHDQKIGGVCAGLATYFGLDPMLVRAGAVVLAFVTGGTVIWVYLAAWWLLPEESRRSGDTEADRQHHHGRHGPFPWCPPWMGGRRRHDHPDLSTICGFALLGVAGVIVFHQLPFFDDDLMLALGLLAVGFGILWFGKQGNAGVEDERWLAGEEPETATTATAATATVTEPALDENATESESESPFEPITPWYEIPIDRPAPAAPFPPAPPRQGRRPGRWIAPSVFGVLLMGAGILGLLVVAGVDVSAGHAFAAGLVVIGSGLVVGSFVGRGRGLVVPAVVLLALLSFGSVVQLPLTAGVGDRNYDELLDEYELGIGDMMIDLSDLSAPQLEDQRFDVRQGIGQLTVIVPRNVSVVVDASAGLGAIWIDGEERAGVQPDFVQRFGGEDPSLEMDLEIGMGEIRVEVARPG